MPDKSSIGRLVLPTIAVAMLLFAFGYAIYSQWPTKIKPPPITPATNPFGNVVAGTGFVEPSTEASTQSMITVAANQSGVVVNVAVHIGQEVQAGELLFQQDSRTLASELRFREAAIAIAEAQLDKLARQPRLEDIPPLEALVEAASGTLATARDVRMRDTKLNKGGSGAVTQQELFASEQVVVTAQAQLEQAKANLTLLKAGAWEPDLALARATILQAKSQWEQTKTSIALLEVRAPAAGTVLQVNITPGEFASASATQPLVVMGNLKPYHVRVSIDEEDIPRLKLNAPAVAMLRGDLQRRKIDMSYVRCEPSVIPKTSLTGSNSERVDTRVMQIIYAINPDHPLIKEHKVMVGQLLDVFIDVQ